MIFSSFNWIIPVIEWWLSWQLSVPVMWPIGVGFRLIIAILLPPFSSPASCLTTHHGPNPSRCLMAACWGAKEISPIGQLNQENPSHWPLMCGVWYGDWPQRYRAAIFASRPDTNCGLGSRTDSSALIHSRGITTITNTHPSHYGLVQLKKLRSLHK